MPIKTILKMYRERLGTEMIHQGDCLAILKEIPNDCVDLTITSPPFNLGSQHHTGNKRHNPYFDDYPEDEYQTKQLEVLNEVYRITKPDGSLIYQHKNRIKKGKQITPYEWLLKSKWIIKQELVWFNRSQNFDKIRFYPMTERVYWLTKSPDTKLQNVINHHDLFTVTDWPPEGTNKSHTRAFPEKFVEDFLKCFPSAITILDPYSGSGTTCFVSKKLGRKWIGIEREEEYCKIQSVRLDDAPIVKHEISKEPVIVETQQPKQDVPKPIVNSNACPICGNEMRKVGKSYYCVKAGCNGSRCV
jgi:modification methylase